MLLSCKECGLVQTLRVLSQNELLEGYKNNPDELHDTQFDLRYKTFLKSLRKILDTLDIDVPVRGKFIDVGCSSGAVLAAAVTSFPLYFISARSAFASVDSAYEQAARLMGCSEWTVFWRITLPLSIRGLVAGGVLGFVRALGDFGATLMVAGNIPGRTRTAALALYDATILGDAARARSLVAVLGAVAVAAIWFAGSPLSKGGR